MAYNDRLFDRLGFEALASKLPELVVSTDVIGMLSDAAADELGLMARTPVAGGLFDVAASAIGSGGAAAGSMSVVAGTWSIATVVTREPLIDRSLLMTTAFADARALDGHRGECHVRGEPRTGSRARRSSMTVPKPAAGSVFDRCCHVAASAGLQGSSPIYHPFLYGSPTDPRARAGFYGISASHGRADLARAVLEGVAFGHRRHVSNLVAAGATPGTRAADRWRGAKRLLVADVRGRARHAHRDPGCRGDRGAGSRAGRWRGHRRVSRHRRGHGPRHEGGP